MTGHFKMEAAVRAAFAAEKDRVIVGIGYSSFSGMLLEEDLPDE
jgi:hypothetical protein